MLALMFIAANQTALTVFEQSLPTAATQYGLSYLNDSILAHGQVTIIFVVSVCLSVCLFVCAELFSAVLDADAVAPRVETLHLDTITFRYCSDFYQAWTYVICLGLVVSPRI